MDDTLTIHEGDSRPEKTLSEWGPFRLLEKVGQGSFGEVYRAYDTVLEREVAVKLLLTGGDGPAAGSDILREARLLARVRHPNVVSIYGVDRFNGRVGFWSDFVKGRTLTALLGLQGPFGAREAAAIGIEICKALSAVHGAGLLHRDIKAGNVMREEGGRILLMDFGLSLEHTGARGLSGTPSYMAPELFEGAHGSVATDIYAVGVLLYHLVTAKYPVDADSLDELSSAHRAGQRRSLYDVRTDLPDDLSRTIETALERDPAKRFQSAGRMLRALSESVGAPPAAPQPVRRRNWSAWAALAAVLAVSTAGIVWWRLPQSSRPGAGAHEAYLKAQSYLDSYYRPGNMANAINWFHKTVSLDPGSALGYGGLCRASVLNFRSNGKPESLHAAEESCSKALRLNSDLASVHVSLGMLYTLTGKNDLAAQELATALRLYPRSAEAQGALAELYIRQGRQSDIEPAFRAAMDLAPRDWRWPNQLAYYYMTMGRLEEATEQFQAALSLSDDNSFAWNNLGMAYLRQHKLDDARKAFEKSVQLAPSDSHIANLGLVLEQQKDYREAAKLYRKAIAIDPTNYLNWGNLASVCDQIPEERPKARENYLKAIELAEKLNREEPDTALVIARLGSFYATLGMADKSLPLVRQAVALDPDESEVLFRAGESYELLHRREDALLWIGKALEHNYSLDSLKQNPEMATLISDPRFVAMSSRLK
jgi:serine/threonine protein kinase